MKSRITFICYFLLMFYAIFLVRGAWLQFFPNERLITAKRKNFEKVIKLKPRRGIIYDRRGHELAISVASYSLFADSFLIKNPVQCARRLGRLLKMSSREIYQKIKNKKRRFVWLKRHISDKNRLVIQSWKIPGLAFLEEPKRVYPNDSLLAQVLGFVGSDGYGLEGIELSYNNVLSGEEKKLLVQKDAKGRPFLFSASGKNPINLRVNGADIYLTIDSDLQFFFERELKKVKQKYRARSAYGLIMDPETGEILAMAHVPSFNLNKPFQVSSKLYRNRCITSAFEPGSTLKPFITSAALKKNIPPSRRYSNHGGALLVEGHLIGEAEPDENKKNETMDLRDILSRSSNIGSAQLAMDIGDHFLYQVLRDFGFGQRLGLKFPGESAGILNKPPWKRLQLATIGFGHGVSTTSLQIAMAYSAIANGGMLKKPYLVRAIDYKESGGSDRREEGKKFFKPVILKRVLSAEQAENITVMLMSVVSNSGTGRRAQVKGFLSAGKTGTAQIVDHQKGGYKPNEYIASFVGFIPAKNPKFVIYTAVDHPKKTFYGSQVAAPVFASVARYAVRQAGLPPELITPENVLKKEILSPKKIGRNNQVKNNQSDRLVAQKKISICQSEECFSTTRTPDFIGLSLREAYRKARTKGVQLRVTGSGQVIRTIPFAGDPLPLNHIVHLIMVE